MSSSLSNVSSSPASQGEGGPSFEILSDNHEAVLDSVPCSVPRVKSNSQLPTTRSTTTNSAVSAALSAKARGATLVGSEAWGPAIAAYSDAILSLPDEDYLATSRAVLLTNRALCHQRLDNWVKCKEDCDTALKYDAESAKAWFRRAQAYLKLGAPERALSDIKQMLKLEPKNRPRCRPRSF